MIDRREFVIALGATGLLAACQSGPPKPSTVSVNVSGGAGMNPGPGGGDRPVTVLVMRLRSTGKFNSAGWTDQNRFFPSGVKLGHCRGFYRKKFSSGAEGGKPDK